VSLTDTQLTDLCEWMAESLGVPQRITCEVVDDWSLGPHVAGQITLHPRKTPGVELVPTLSGKQTIMAVAHEVAHLRQAQSGVSFSAQPQAGEAHYWRNRFEVEARCVAVVVWSALTGEPLGDYSKDYFA
jgi:hypothetical protein